jgi:hypothetical protein
MKAVQISVGDEVCVLAQDLTSSDSNGNNKQYFVASGKVIKIDREPNTGSEVVVEYDDYSSERTGKDTVAWGVSGIYIKAIL